MGIKERKGQENVKFIYKHTDARCLTNVAYSKANMDRIGTLILQLVRPIDHMHDYTKGDLRAHTRREKTIKS